MLDIDARAYGYEPAQSQLRALRAELEQYQRKALDLKFDNIEKDKLIEELLEAEIEPIVGVFRNGHLVTYRQIDAAWESANDPNQPKEIRKAKLRFLERFFHVAACAKCGGCRMASEWFDLPHPHREYIQCPGCNGHGWKVASNA